MRYQAQRNMILFEEGKVEAKDYNDDKKNHPELQLAPPFAGNSQSRRYKRCQISNAITKDKFLIERILQIRGALQRISEKEYCTRKGIVVTESDHSTPRRNHKNSRL
ncbi:6249_t:CDS:2 [Entrophospora sp. SA101]|nr:6249_t:CDS:2 [Entrophospora sp. SA101]